VGPPQAREIADQFTEALNKRFAGEGSTTVSEIKVSARQMLDAFFAVFEERIKRYLSDKAQGGPN